MEKARSAVSGCAKADAAMDVAYHCFCGAIARGLDELDWPEGIKLLQRNWIGRSQGAEIDFKIENVDQQIRVFTTRPDTFTAVHSWCSRRNIHWLI
jgi:Leucyl-tRNA synthetase